MSKKNNSKDSPLLKALGIFLILGIGLFLFSYMLLNGNSANESNKINDSISIDLVFSIVKAVLILGGIVVLLNWLLVFAGYALNKSPFVVFKNSKFEYYKQIFIVLKGLNLNNSNSFDVVKNYGIIGKLKVSSAILRIKKDLPIDDTAVIDGVRISAPTLSSGFWKITAVIKLKSTNRTFKLLVYSQKDSDLSQNPDFLEWFEKRHEAK